MHRATSSTVPAAYALLETGWNCQIYECIMNSFHLTNRKTSWIQPPLLVLGVAVTSPCTLVLSLPLIPGFLLTWSFGSSGGHPVFVCQRSVPAGRAWLEGPASIPAGAARFQRRKYGGQVVHGEGQPLFFLFFYVADWYPIVYEDQM